MLPRALAILVVLTASGSAVALRAGAAERDCDQSDSTIVTSPRGQLAASVQHQVCQTAGGVAAAVTVFIGDAKAPLQGTRVLAIAVPRAREEWPRVVWRSDTALEVWVPNFAKVLEALPSRGEVTVTLRYCGDDPEARARAAQYQTDLQRWMQAVTAWSDARKRDPMTAGERPQRPREPQQVSRACRDSDLQQGANLQFAPGAEHVVAARRDHPRQPLYRWAPAPRRGT